MSNKKTIPMPESAIDQPILFYMIMSQKSYHRLLALGFHLGMLDEPYAAIAEEVAAYRETRDTDAVPLVSLQYKDRQVLHAILEAEHINVPEHLDEYFRALQKRYLKRMTRALLNTCDFTPESILKASESMINLVTDSKLEGTQADLSNRAFAETDNRHSADYHNPYRTGLSPYDQLGHFEPGSLVIIGGKSGHGKSRLALNLSLRWLETGMQTIYASYEMTDVACMWSLALIKSGLSWNGALRQKGERFTPEQLDLFKLTLAEVADMPLVITETATTIPQIQALAHRYHPKVIVIDTINELISDDALFWIKLGHLASGYKMLAKKYRCIVVVLAQLGNITERPTKKEMLAESKRMKNTADYIDFIYRAQEDQAFDCPPCLHGVMEVYRVKGRLTGIGRAWLSFDAPSGRIDTLGVNRTEDVKDFFTISSTFKRRK